jgi:hypothetical protein
MTLQASGSISMSDIAEEFGGVAPHALSEFYSIAAGVPSAGPISLSNFYGKSRTADNSYTGDFTGVIFYSAYPGAPAYSGGEANYTRVSTGPGASYIETNDYYIGP